MYDFDTILKQFDPCRLRQINKKRIFLFVEIKLCKIYRRRRGDKDGFLSSQTFFFTGWLLFRMGFDQRPQQNSLNMPINTMFRLKLTINLSSRFEILLDIHSGTQTTRHPATSRMDIRNTGLLHL